MYFLQTIFLTGLLIQRYLLLCVRQAVRRTTARCTGQYKYGIEIYVSGYEYGVNLAEYLVATQRARVSHEHIQVPHCSVFM